MSFLFYGRDPSDWFETCRYEVAFAAAPDHARRIQLAETVERRFARGPARIASDPMQFGGTFWRFDVEAGWPGAERAMFRAVADLLREIDRETPIIQVINFGARAPGTSTWDTQTAARQPTPSAGPAYTPAIDMRVVWYRRANDESVAAPDPDVEAVRARVRNELEAAIDRAKLEKVATKSKLTPFPGERLPSEVPYAEAARAKFIETDTPDAGHPRPFAWVHEGEDVRGAAYIDDHGERRQVAGLPPADSRHWYFSHLKGPWWSDDGRTMWLVLYTNMYRVDVADGIAHDVVTYRTGIQDAVILADGRWVISTSSSLELFDLAGMRVQNIQKARESQLYAVLGGQLVMAVQSDRLEAWMAVDEELKRLALYNAPLRGPVEVDGQIVVYGPDGCVSLDGLPEKLYTAQRKAAKPKKPAA